MRLLLLALLGSVRAEPPSVETLSAHLNVDIPVDIADQYAIFAAESSSSTAMSFTLEHTRVTIIKHAGANSSALSASRRGPRIVVVDAAAKGLVCLPKGSVPEVEAVGGEATGEVEKADLEVVGQGSGITAAVGAASSASASAGGASASAASGGSAAASAAGSGSASAAAAGSSSAASSASGQSSSAASAGGGEAEASGGDSRAASHSEEGEISVDVSGQDAEAAALGAGGVSITLSGEGDYEIIDESNCECVPDYLCDEEGFINTFGAGLIDIRQYKGKTESKARARASKCKADETCCRHRTGEDKAAIGWLPTRCGTRSPIRLDARIVGGDAARQGKYPWMVALLKREHGSDELKYLCGGSLIAEDVVLTGAHCVKAHLDDVLIARIGEWDTSNEDPIYPHQDIEVAQTVYHDDFNDKTLFNDVALLKLKEPVEIQPHVNTMCLPSEDDYHIDYSDCVATGWGKDSFENGVYSNILKEVFLSKVDSSQCQDHLRQTRLGRWFKLHNSFLCAGGHPGVDTCKGDGGSPMVCRDHSPDLEGEEAYVQVGIVAWGIGCGRGGIPGVYADVIKLLPWIREHLTELETPPYP